ncbi:MULTISPECIES: hypothetical protein [Pseudomonas]|uniref:hypothetical protein n=1 Tax=Pseudomonas TaxID=286 RepID=UPI00123B979A|nr:MULTISPECIES: hypothetical protein [Pseudomonas]QIB51311.1 hypothetical protein G3M63_09775 [Pseudomonas sp. OIL-1]
MKNLFRALIPLAFIVVSPALIAEDGSDYALNKAPSARAPQMIQSSSQPRQQLNDVELDKRCC